MIIVFGSINMDMIFDLDHFPAPGETIASPPFSKSHGGKGANQALAAARLNAKTALVGATGDDDAGHRMLDSLRREGVIVSGVKRVPDPSGTAIILRDARGENQIIVSSSANLSASAEQVPNEILTEKNIVLLQMETDHAENEALIKRAHARGTKTILNLAPAAPVPEPVLKALDYLIVNEGEVLYLGRHLRLDAQDFPALARTLADTYGLTCIVTLGEKGVIAAAADGQMIAVPAVELPEIVDTTGAGDAFCGSFAAALHEGKGLEEALCYAAAAGSLACTGKGAQSSYAYAADIEKAAKSLQAQIS